MLQRNIRLRREYLYRKSLEGKERQLYVKKRKIKLALQEGKPIPTDDIVWRNMDGNFRHFSVSYAWDSLRSHVEVWTQIRDMCDMDYIPPRIADVMAFIIPIAKGSYVIRILSSIVVDAIAY